MTNINKISNNNNNNNVYTNDIGHKAKHVDTSRYAIASLDSFLIVPLATIFGYFGWNTILAAIVVTAVHHNLKPLLEPKGRKESTTIDGHQMNLNEEHPHSNLNLFIVILYSLLLGILFSVGLSFIDGKLESHFVPLGFYIILLSSFHFSEFFVTSLTNPATLSNSSFLIDQSSAYVIAISSSFVEYLVEAYLISDFKKFNVVSMIGLVMAICGELVRKSAMITAGKNFTHYISVSKSPHHELITHGIYSVFRHPSYAGWFYWAIGSQIMLLNPICVVLFTVISYKFFKDRISYEEALLIKFFKDDYVNYKKKVRLWMPISLQ
jgi:protein-S-isoprenylcysteine O-methyltransferase